ncbi:MAG: hypothetical protein JJE30_11130 [Desulfuromonadales bacterium]|nr:hypothetical protein [Desulfuromonadales bacterium]
MIIHLLDDDPNNINRFRSIGYDQIIKNLSEHKSSYAKTFLDKKLEINLKGTQVTDYDAMAKETNSSVKEHADLILLLDCHLNNCSDVPENISRIIIGLPTDSMFIIGLTTTLFNPNAITEIIRKESKEHLPLVVPLVGCTTPENSLENIVNAILYWEERQHADNKYTSFFHELFSGYNYELLSHHPPIGDKARIELFSKKFPNIFSLGINPNFINRQIYEIAASDAPQGMGLEAAWLLAMLKSCELFPSDYASFFSVTSLDNWKKRSQRSEEHPFIPPQSEDDRINTLLAFGKFCETHFVHKEDQQKEQKRCVLTKAELVFDSDSFAKEVHFKFSWPTGHYAQNVIAAFAFMRNQLSNSSCAYARPQHDASVALVDFLTHTTKSLPVDETCQHLSGTCTNVRIHPSVASTNIVFYD